MKSLFVLIIASCMVMCSIVLPEKSHASRLGKVDDLLEAVIQFNRKSPAGMENKFFKQTDSFESLIRRDTHLSNRINRPVSFSDDAQAVMKRLNIPQGSKYADEFLSLGPGARHAVTELGSTVQKVLNRSDGTDLLQRLDKSGLLMVQRFGDDILEPVSTLIKNDEIWGEAGMALKSVGKLNSDQLRKLRLSMIDPPTSVNLDQILRYPGFSNAERVDLFYDTMKKYGKSGFNNLKEFTQKTWNLAKRHPKKAATGLSIAIVWINPDLVLTPMGNLKANALELLVGLSEKIGETIVEVPVVVAEGIKQGAAQKINEKFQGLPPQLGDGIASIFGWIISLSVIMAALFLIPQTRFIPMIIFAATIGRLKNKFRRKSMKKVKAAKNYE
jgi:hypothetical protein